MAPKLTHLQSKVHAQLRTPEHLAPRGVQVRCDDAVRMLQIELPYGPEDNPKMAPPDKSIKVSEITAVKARDYPDGHSLLYALTIMQQGGQQYSLQFESQEVRDNWHEGLRSLLPNKYVVGGGEVKVPKSRFTSIVKLAINDASPELVASIKLDLASDEQVFLNVRKDTTSPEALKQVTQDFIEQHSIFPSEMPSLFRFVRAVVARVVMAAETTAIIDEINAQHLEELLKDKGNRASVRDAMDCAMDTLRDLELELPSRIGRQGAGPLLVTQILKDKGNRGSSKEFGPCAAHAQPA